jgi:hypothetical protein
MEPILEPAIIRLPSDSQRCWLQQPRVAELKTAS